MNLLRALFCLTLVVMEAPLHANAQDRVEALLAQMTLEEKAGQLSQVSVQATPTGPVIQRNERSRTPLHNVGSVLGAQGARWTRELQRQVVQGSRLHIPLLFAFDVIHGYRTVFPVPLAEAAAWDPELSYRTARAAAVEASANGIHWTFAPMVDIARDARWGRVVEGAGEDPFLGAALAVARVHGFHGDGPGDPSFMLATAKHFVAYGAAEAGRDYNIADISERTLREVYLPPFRAAVQAGVDAVMPGFNEVAATPMHSNTALLRDLLRRQWGFEGLIVSDFTGVDELIAHGVAQGPAQAARLAFDATVDIDMVSQFYAGQLPTLVREGRLSEAALDDAVRRVLKTKQRLGLFDDPYRYSDETREQALTLTAESRALAREAAQKSIVLLKNTQALLPLPKDAGKLLVVGSLAEDASATLGAWALAGRSEDSISVLQGIRAAVSPATQVTYLPGAAPDSPDTRGIAAAQRAASEADVVVAVVGETADMSGEARSSVDLGLPGAQDELLQRLLETGKPLVVVLMNGRPLALSKRVEQAPAILEAWFLGSQMGNGLADVLFGDVNPSGKLPITFPRSVGQLPIYYAYKNTGRPPRERDGYVSGYQDQSWSPLYPFGHGLSYTTFSYSTPRLSSDRLTSRQTLSVEVTVRNTGQRPGDEVVQLYLRDDVASVTRPVRALRGFAKVHLAAGEARSLTFELDENDFALLDEGFSTVVEAGSFTVFVGGSSATDNQAQFQVIDSRRLPGQGSAIPRMLRR